MESNTLFIVIKGIYFDQIKAGIKKEEYRLITKYWASRLEGRHYTHVIFQRGYTNAQKIKVEYKGYYKRYLTHEHFGGKEVHVFAIKLGNVL